MLVLSRKLGESIEIGDQNVIVRVLGIKRSKVQLGVDAPPDVAIHRSEIAVSTAGAGHYRPSPVDPSRKGNHTSPQTTKESSSDNRLDDNPAEPVNGSLTPNLGESILQDLARVQAEVAALAEMVSDRDQSAARELAAEAVDRLSSIERTVRLGQRQTCEQPISAFVGSRSQRLKKLRRDDQSVDLESNTADQEWDGRRDESATFIRESKSPFTVSSSHCSVA